MMGWKGRLQSALHDIDRAMDDNQLSDEKYNQLKDIHETMYYMVKEEEQKEIGGQK